MKSQMNKRPFLVSCLCALGLMTPWLSYAESPNYVAYAKVIEVQAHYSTIEERQPKERCWTETVREEHHTPAQKNASSTIVGGVIGGALGNAVGKGGDNKKIGTAVGAVLGAAIGNDIGKQNQRPAQTQVVYKDVERCEMTERVVYREVVDGYDVRYRFHGQEYTTFMNDEPGDKIKVAVQVTPLE